MIEPPDPRALAALPPESLAGGLEAWLTETRPEMLQSLHGAADRCRRAHLGEAVHLRGLVEISNHCRRACHYCGLRAPNPKVRRYRLTPEEIRELAHSVARAGAGTIVLQAGEDPALTGEGVAALVRHIKAETPLAVTLSLGERDDADYFAWRRAGADRYLLRFETSLPRLYEALHPPCGPPFDRVAALGRLRAMGYEIGSGLLFGLPGQTLAALAGDLVLLAGLELDMIGSGPYIPHPDTPLGRRALRGSSRAVNGSDTAPPSPAPGPLSPSDQVPGTLEMAYRVIALCRLLAPRAHIPATTALATLGGEEARTHALAVGANVIMPNFTPPSVREKYEIYPNKACPPDSAEVFCQDVQAHLRAMGRTLGKGPGSPRGG